MAKKKSGGFKAPGNYDPRRGKRPTKAGRFGVPEGERATDRSAGGRGADPRGEKRGDFGAKGAGRDGSRREGAVRDGGGRDGGGRDGGAKGAPVKTGQAKNFPAQGGTRGAQGPVVLDAPRQDSGTKLANIKTQVTTAADAAHATWEGLGLGGNIVRTLGELGASQPFPIQVATIPDAIEGHDILGKAATGSGKTIAFGAALVERMLFLKAAGKIPPAPKKPKLKRGERMPKAEIRKPRAVILAPTRELALQIDRTVQPIARSVGLYTAQLVGGVPIDPQVVALERGIDIVIGTPGRIIDLVQRRKLDLREVLITVIDEADHLCELGFLDSTQKIMRQTVRGGQRMLFSATLDRDVQELVEEFLSEPRAHEIEVDARAGKNVPHRVLLVQREEKDAATVQLAELKGSVMMFCRTRLGTERVTELLTVNGVSAVALHGDLSQARRERNLEKFATGKARVLVATDVAARGIHVDDVDHVVQVDAPHDHKAYLHRSGRTGRAGKRGNVFTLSLRNRQKLTKALLDEAGVKPVFFGPFTPGMNPTKLRD